MNLFWVCFSHSVVELLFTCLALSSLSPQQEIITPTRRETLRDDWQGVMPCFFLAESFSSSPSGGHFVFLALKNYNFEIKLYGQQVGDVGRQHVLQMLGFRIVSEAPLTFSKIHRTCSRTSRIFSWILWPLEWVFLKPLKALKLHVQSPPGSVSRCSTWRHIYALHALLSTFSFPRSPLHDFLCAISCCRSLPVIRLHCFYWLF